MKINKYKISLPVIVEGTSIDYALERLDSKTGILEYLDESEEVDYQIVGETNKIIIGNRIKGEQ